MVILIVLPLIFYYFQGNDLTSDGRGLQPETRMILVKSLNEQLNAKQCPIHLAAIKEFRPLTTHSQNEEQFLKTVDILLLIFSYIALLTAKLKKKTANLPKEINTRFQIKPSFC